MTVKIGQNEYVTVAERVASLHDANIEARITTELVSEDADQVTVKAEVIIAKGVFTGHARSRKTARTIEGQAPLEVAETSAVGRALGFAGYGSVESIASAEEVIVAQQRSPAPVAGPVGEATLCPHGTRVWRTGTSKTGVPWRAWMCPSSNRSDQCDPIWVKDKPEMDEGRDIDDDFE